MTTCVVYRAPRLELHADVLPQDAAFLQEGRKTNLLLLSWKCIFLVKKHKRGQFLHTGPSFWGEFVNNLKIFSASGSCTSRRGLNGACSVHEYTGSFQGQTVRFKMTSVCGHVMSLDFIGRWYWWKICENNSFFYFNLSLFLHAFNIKRLVKHNSSAASKCFHRDK